MSESDDLALWRALPRRLRRFSFSLHIDEGLVIVACADDGTRREIHGGQVTLCTTAREMP